MASLIPPDNTWALWAVIVFWVALSIRLEQRYRWVAKVSGPIVVLLGAILLANFKVIPTESPVYDTVWNYVVPVSIPLLLFRANIVTIIRESGRMFLAFHICAAGTMVGAVAAAVVLQASLPHTAEMAGIMTGSYTGGSVNFVALTATFDSEKSWTSIVNSLIVADNLVMALVFLICFAMVSAPLMRRFFGPPRRAELEVAEEGEGTGGMHAAEYWKPKPISLLDIATALAIAVGIAAAAHLLAAYFKRCEISDGAKLFLGQPYLVMTTICIVVATVFHRQLQRVAGAEELGTYLIYLFFFVIGAPANVVKIVREVPLLFVFCGIMAAFNLLFGIFLGRLFRCSLAEVAVGCNATLGGAPSAAAMAIAKGWRSLVLPAILVGIWGYVVGTYLGIAVGTWLLDALGVP